jgi:hypothetical protein
MTRERRLTAILVATLATVVLIGMGSAFAVGRIQHAGAGTTGGSGSVVTGTTRASAPPTAGSTVTSAGSPTPAGSTTPADAAGTSGGVDVTLSAEAESSRYADQVRSLLQRYFDAINAHDYRAWTEAVTSAQSSHWAEQDWQRAYASTADSDVYVSDITEGAPLTVRIQFVSHQDVQLAPTSLPVTCINWDVIYRLEPSDSGLRVGTSTRDPYLVRCR